MIQKVATSLKKPAQSGKINPLETLKDFESGMFDQLQGNFSEQSREKAVSSDKTRQNQIRKEFSLFSYQEHYENQVIKQQIKELTEAIKKEIELIKISDKSLLSDINDIQKLTIESLPSNAGIYHVRFLEIVLAILKSLRAKVSESRTWLQALISKKKKRGSLFAVFSKKKGTQYSLSQELQSARSIQ